MAEPDETYEVGYGKPPKQNQFKGGTSGNPKGRPKGSKNLATIVAQESRRMVKIKGTRGTRQISAMHAAVMQLTNKAAQGDLRAQRDFFALIKEAETSKQANTASRDGHELNRKAMEHLVQRIRKTGTT